MKKLPLAALLLTTIISLASCGSPATAYNASGTWNGTATNTNNNNFVSRQRLVITDNNGYISGTDYIIIEDGTAGAFGTISGTRNANGSAVLTVTSTLAGSPGTFVFSGTFSGNSFTGTYTASGGGAGPFSFTR